MTHIGIGLLIGHILGDFVFQNDWMAQNKMKPGREGRRACLLHCVIYSLCVAGCMTLDGWTAQDSLFFRFSHLFAGAIAFVTHYPVDRWRLGTKWIEFYGQSNDFKTNPFVPCVYIGVDNGIHLALMWVLYSWLGVQA